MNRIERILSNFAGFRSKMLWKRRIAAIYYLLALCPCFWGLYGTALSLFLICAANFAIHFLSIFFSVGKSTYRQVVSFASLSVIGLSCLFLLPSPLRPISSKLGPSVVYQTITPSAPPPSSFVTSTTPPPLQASNPAAENQEELVYITLNGKKYHQNVCPSLAHSAISIVKEEALQKGYTACKRCKP